MSTPDPVNVLADGLTRSGKSHVVIADVEAGLQALIDSGWEIVTTGTGVYHATKHIVEEWEPGWTPDQEWTA